MDGIINVYKERGFTSHDVVAKLRGILKMKKIGHTGTLDPDACGVLPVCLGQATKVCDLLTDRQKTYEAVLLLGRETDTQDVSGETVREMPVNVSEEQVWEAVDSFRGEQLQVPPMYSARKVNGKKLYELAREGKIIEREARPVTFYEIRILRMELPRVEILVTCSKGTYIRTLCHDIGQKLGCGGCMEKLLRTEVVPFQIGDSLTLARIEELRDEGRLADIICPVDRLFEGLPARQIRDAYARYLYNGNPLCGEWLQAFGQEPESEKPQQTPGQEPGSEKPQQTLGQESGAGSLGRIRLYNEKGEFFGIYDWSERESRYRVKKIFYSLQAGKQAGKENG